MLRAAVVAIVAALATLPSCDTSERTVDDARIDTYRALLELDRDGVLRTDETLTVVMPPGKRGIFRIFDTADPRRDGITHPVTVESVERDDRSEPWTTVDGARGTTTIRIGSESVYLDPGLHRYRIRSVTDDVFEPGPDGVTWWWWDLIGEGWQMSMDDAQIVVDLPAAPRSVECVKGADDDCEVQVDGARLVADLGVLEPFTAVTLRVAFDADDVAAPAPGDSGTTTLVLMVLAGLLAAGIAALLWRATREAEPGFPVLFEPPFLVPPALGVKVLDEHDSSADVQATLFDLAERGVLSLEGDDDEWVVRSEVDPAQRTLHPAEQRLLDELGLDGVGASFRVSSSVSSGETLSSARTALRAEVAAAARRYLHPSWQGWLSVALGWLGLIGLVGLGGWYLFGDGARWNPLTVAAAVFAFALAGAMVDVGVLTTRTVEGRDLWSRAGGFARFLTTDSSESRFDAAAHLDWYPRYLAWAVALGSAEQWARRYEAQGVPTPTVPWMVWTGAGTANFSSARMNSSFDAAITSASAAYAASQSSSSGGGGFSGGSGGGGGGGGSW